jgi:hypothetical protein
VTHGTDIPRTAFLEKYFEKYPDTPREVILKSDLLSVGQWVSDAALDAAEGALVKSYRLFSYDLVPMADMKRRESQRVPEYFTIRGGPYGLRPVNVQTSLSPDSPYRLDVIDGQLVLTTAGRILCEVRYPRAPDYYARRLADGTPYHEIIANGFFVTAFRACQYQSTEEQCRFCDINENTRQMKQSKDFALTASVKPVSAVVEVADAIQREQTAQHDGAPSISFLVTGGTITGTLHGQNEDAFYAEYVRALKEGGPRRHVSLQTIAKRKDTLRWYRSQGLDSHHANMEVWDTRLFDWLCPGKARSVGRDEWVKRLLDSVEIFGAGEVKPIFVSGIEMARPHGFRTVQQAVASTTEGIAFLMARGVVPRFNQWRREPRSEVCRECEQPPVPLDFHIQLMRNRYEIWKQHGLPLPKQGRLLVPTCYIGAPHGTYEDYILLAEDTYPADIDQIVDRHSLQQGEVRDVPRHPRGSP